jgi:hypothetical protein
LPALVLDAVLSLPYNIILYVYYIFVNIAVIFLPAGALSTSSQGDEGEKHGIATSRLTLSFGVAIKIEDVD